MSLVALDHSIKLCSMVWNVSSGACDESWINRIMTINVVVRLLIRDDRIHVRMTQGCSHDHDQ